MAFPRWRLCKKLDTDRQHCIKGELNRFFLSAQSFYRPQTKTSLKGNFHRKARKWVKNQDKGSKIDQIRTKWHPTCWGNPPILSSELLRESINSVIRPTEGIHLLTISASDLLRDSTDSVLEATEGFHQFCHSTYWGNHSSKPALCYVTKSIRIECLNIGSRESGSTSPHHRNHGVQNVSS